jgi:hypothetical protein
VIFAGNTAARTTSTAATVRDDLQGAFAVREFNSMRGAWTERGRLTAAELERGVAIDLERSGFCILVLRQDV